MTMSQCAEVVSTAARYVLEEDTVLHLSAEVSHAARTNEGDENAAEKSLVGCALQKMALKIRINTACEQEEIRTCYYMYV
jgi:hypothetical protein